MTVLNTANQQVPYPDHNEYLKNNWAMLQTIVQFLEKQLVMKFASSADLAARVPTPTEGMVAWMMDSNQLMAYDGTVWQRVWPTAPAIYSGTTAPASGTGTVGDLYLQY